MPNKDIDDYHNRDKDGEFFHCGTVASYSRRSELQEAVERGKKTQSDFFPFTTLRRL